MNHLDALLQAVATSPADLTRQLILADYLEEHGSSLAQLWRMHDLHRTAVFTSVACVRPSAVRVVAYARSDGDGTGFGSKLAMQLQRGDGYQIISRVPDGDGEGAGSSQTIDGDGMGEGPGVFIGDHFDDQSPAESTTMRWVCLGATQ